MYAASRHGTPSLASLPKDGGVSCFLVLHLKGRPSSFWPYTAMLNFSEANGTGWTAWPVTPLTSLITLPPRKHMPGYGLASIQLMWTYFNTQVNMKEVLIE